ncbi:hypothetical protein J6590_058541 [Homalodisca vitripennis]|nr:hypothetical protein J6590_058541 [Homalodisca vitripennis]
MERVDFFQSPSVKPDRRKGESIIPQVWASVTSEQVPTPSATRRLLGESISGVTSFGK